MSVFQKKLPRGTFCTFQSKPNIALLQVKQTHSSIVLPEDHCDNLEGDGIVGNSNTPLAILTADCMPIVLLGSTHHAIIHAGWRGLQSEILLNDQLKKIKPIYAFFGPHIAFNSYEVQNDFKENFLKYPNAFRSVNDKLYFDMEFVAKFQLENNYPGIKIETSGIDTLSDDKFCSYRQNKTANRNWNLYIP